MPSLASAGNERIIARVSPELKDEIEKKAEAEGQPNPTEWIRLTLAKACESDQTERPVPGIDHLAQLIEARFDRLERRIFDENSVIFKMGFEILLDVAHVRASSLSALIILEDSTPEEEKALHDHLEQEGKAYYLGRRDALFSEMNEMRIDARDKAEASAKPSMSGEEAS